MSCAGMELDVMRSQRDQANSRLNLAEHELNSIRAALLRAAGDHMDAGAAAAAPKRDCQH